MTGPKRDDELSFAIGWIVAVLLAVILLGMLALASFRQAACAGIAGDCVREWIAALSGWAAAATAGATIAVLYGQLKHQQRQTDFLLGDGLPSIDAVQHIAETSTVVLRIVNWNRRTIILRDISFEHPSRRVYGIGVKATDLERLKPIPIKGWVKSSRDPVEWKDSFVVAMMERAGDPKIDPRNDIDLSGLKVLVTYEFVGMSQSVTESIDVHSTSMLHYRAFSDGDERMDPDENS